MAKSSTIVQVELVSRHEHGSTGLVCWVDPRVQVGDRITLRDSDDPTRLWDVVDRGLEVLRSSVRQDWHNNI